MSALEHKPLWHYATSKKTTERYTTAAGNFLSWCSDHGESANTFHQLDQLLADYVQFLFDSGGSLSNAANAVRGITLLLPWVKPHLFLVSMNLRGWRKQHLPVAHPPLTWNLTCAIAIRLIQRGFWRYAVGTLLAFDCFLRISELCSLVKEDVSFPGDSRVDKDYQRVGIRLRHTKTGPNKFVEVHSEPIIMLLRDIIGDTPKRGLVFQCKPQQFRYQFKAACRDLGLAREYVPHSLRHGGATYWSHVLRKPIQDVMHRGRWASRKSTEHYLQAGASILLSVKVPLQVAELGQQISDNLLLFFYSADQQHVGKSLRFAHHRDKKLFFLPTRGR